VTELAFDVDRLVDDLVGSELEPWSVRLGQSVRDQEHALKHGHLAGWEAAVAALPLLADIAFSVNDGVVTIDATADSEDTEQQLKEALQGLIPWRKGPFKFASETIDTEWRSDWKWDRIESYLTPLDGRVVLDVGCGSGYHLWRMRDAGARQILGIDPSLLYLMQFNAVQHYIDDCAVQFLPLPMEALPPNMAVFDTVFSMGVLYHRRDPGSHLRELQEAMKSGGELVLETLVVPGDTDSSLLLDSRYANMRNIYELPTVSRLESWIRDAGFSSVRTVSVDVTSRSEQRSTQWMPSYSLAEALDPDDSSLTIEGHPRPLRAVVLAQWAG
jgi:tRNA (mo5U34)-methyltransferase